MKKFFGLITFAIALSAQAQVLPGNQCPQPGVLLSRDYVGLHGETARASHSREGTAQIPATAEFRGLIKTQIYKVFQERHCVTKSHHYQQQVCADVPVELARGMGNNTLKSIFDLNLTLLKRSEIFASQVRYGVGATSAARLTTATEVVKNLTRLATSMGVPKSWENLVQMLKKVMEEGLLTQAEYDDLLVTNAAHNRRSLGFEPLPGVQANEGKGNGKLQRMFDLNSTAIHRAAQIRNNIQGVTQTSAQALAKSFIDFATANGIPHTWNQFILLMRDAVARNAISQAEFINITENLEFANRQSLGFEIRYFTCKMESRVHYFNAVEEARKLDFDREAAKNYSITVANAPLLRGERESIDVLFNGLSEVSVSASQNYNTFTIERSDAGEVANFKLTGARKRVTPPNSIVAQVLHQGDKININLQNTAFNAGIGGIVVVEVTFFEKVALLKDKNLGTRTFELKDGNMTGFTPNVQMIKKKRKAYVELKMKVVGSAFYNEALSEMKEFKE